MENLQSNNDQFFRFITMQYGFNTVKLLKSFMNENKKLAKCINKQHFLLNCRREKVYSKTRILKNGTNINSDVFIRLQNKFIFGVMNQEIKETIMLVKETKQNAVLLQQQIEAVLPEIESNEFFRRSNEFFIYHFNEIKVRQRIKFNNLLLDDLNELSGNLINTCDKWLVNISNLDLPLHAKIILSLGNKFCPPSIGCSVPYFKIISDVESALFHLNDNDRFTIRNRFINILTNFKYNSNSRKLTPFEIRILGYVKQTKSFLKDNPDIVVTRADKGNITVITSRTDYVEKMESLLVDNTTYIQLPKDNSVPIQKSINKMVKDWKESGNIDEATRKSLTKYNSVIPKLYGLPKIHKSGIPYRPIISSINGPTHCLSSFLGNILKFSVGKTNSNIQNSEDFKQKILNVTIPQNYLLVSLDVSSLFTNVDNACVSNIIKRNWGSIKRNSKTKLTKIQFMTALDIVLTNSDFSFGNKIYKQTFGSPMGSPISPIIANLMMEHLENLGLNSLDFQPLFYFRYVDDIITAIPENKIETFLDVFNSLDNRIKFTIEKEVDNKISFLDLLLIHEPDGKISFDWFHKNTWSGRYLNFYSWLPTSYKINTVKILTQKILKLSDTKFHYNNFKLLENTLLINHYPKKLINNVIWKQRNYFQNSRTNLIVENTLFLSVPYIKTLFEKIKHLFKNYNFKIIGRSASSLNDILFSKLKDPIPLNKKSNLIYQIKCNDCEVTYTGQTKQFLRERFYQHVRGGNGISDEISALSEHIRDRNHNIILDDVKILEEERNFRKRSFLEMLYIKSSSNSINKISDYAYLGNSYDLFL